ncbi:hypothetical protein CLOM_g8853 [Closterium sp. NIES-68]|nr:hypothetical protein CLOM_g8853 [Closterium sp. NIES-68]
MGPVQRQFRLTQPKLEELRKQLDYSLEKKIIRPSSWPFAAPILFTLKKDGGYRMCTNYRALNRVTINPVLRIADPHRPFERAIRLRELLLQDAHDNTVSGHFGVEKTRQQLTRYYFWPAMQGDVQRHVGSCRTCQTMKSSKQKPAGQLQPIPLPECAWQQMTMDFVTRLPSLQ